MKRFRLFFRLALVALTAAVAIAQTGGRRFYIDYTPGVGSNSNPGTSTAAPWKTHPYMPSAMACTGSGSAPLYNHQPGDQFIFKGGVTWPSTCFEMNILLGGSSASTVNGYNQAPIINGADYYGADVTWFVGASFTRPIFDMQGNFISGNAFAPIISAASYITLDNIEIAHAIVSAGCGGGNICFDGGSNQVGVTVNRMYIHDWAYYTPLGYSHEAGAVAGTVNSAPGINVYNTTWSDQNPTTNGGSGVTTSRTGACGVYLNAFAWNTCMFTAEGVLSIGGGGLPSGSMHDNVIHDLDGTYISTLNCQISCEHSNTIEMDYGGHPAAVYNNYFYNNLTGFNAICPGTNFYNNVIHIQAAGGGDIVIDTLCNGVTASTPTLVANNTIDTNNASFPAINCIRIFPRPGQPIDVSGVVTIQNNICIGSGVIDTSGATQTPVVSNNTAMSNSDATMYGFTPTNLYAPTSSDPAVSGQGLNLTSLCINSLLSLCSDARGAPWFGGSYKLRTAPWDTGAMAGFGGGTVTPPAVSISISPSAQPVSGSIFATSTCTPHAPATIASQTFKIDAIPFGATGTTSPFSVIFNTLTSANGQHAIQSTCTDSNGQQTSASITVTVLNSMPGCFVSGNNQQFNSYISFGAQTGTFNFTIGPITPWTNNQDSVIAFSAAPMSAYGQGAVLFRFNSSGNIDAWSQAFGNYTAANAAPYSASGNYFFSGTINIPAGTYSLTETAPSNIVIASSGTPFQFRSSATPSPLGYLNGISDNSTPDTARICNLSIGGTAGAIAVAPASLNLGSVPLTSSSSKPVTVTVTGNPVTISSTSISGTNAADFAIGASTCTGTVGAQCSIPITFTPSIVGAESATLTVNSNASNNPQNVALSGSGTPQASVSPTSFSFGTVKTTQSVTLSGTLTNNGAAALTSIVESYSGNSQFALASATSPDCQSTSSLAVGAICNFALTFTPTAATSYTGTLSLASSMTGSPITVAATGTGLATLTLSLSPASVNFGSVPVSASASQTVTGATSGGSITFTSVAVGGTNAADFVIGTNTCMGTVPTSCAIPITFTPSIVGAESATLTVTSNASNSPQTVALSGTGTAQAAVTPTSMAFGNVFVGNSGVMQGTFTNSGGAYLTSVAISVSGTGFTLVAPSGTDCRASSVLAAGASCNIGVQFAPGSATSFSGSVSVASSMIGSPLSISLSGTGVSPPTPVLSFNLSEIDFGSFALTNTSLPIGIIGTPSGGSVTFTGNPVLGGTNAADFSLPTIGCKATISTTCTDTIQFTPSIVGPESATLTYTDNANLSPQVIVLTGAGLPQAVVSPGSLTFGNVRIGSPSQLAVALKNNGGLALSSIVVSYSGASQFTLVAPSGADCRSIASLPAGSSCTIVMQFLPTTNSTFTGTLSIASNMLGSPLQLAVSGTGKKGGRPSGGKNFVGLVLRTIEGKGE